MNACASDADRRMQDRMMQQILWLAATIIISAAGLIGRKRERNDVK